MTRAIYPKQTCFIIGCSHWTRTIPPEFFMVCARCYRLADKRLRRRNTTIRRLCRKLGEWDYDRGCPSTPRARRLYDRVWKQIVDQAQLRLAGL